MVGEKKHTHEQIKLKLRNNEVLGLDIALMVSFSCAFSSWNIQS